MNHAVRLSTTRVFVFSDSVLCLGGRIAGYPQSVQSWMNRVEWTTQATLHRELDNIDGEPVMFEWKAFPVHTTLALFRRVQNMMEKDNIQPEDLKDRIIFMSMHSDIDWSQKGNEESCERNSSSVA